MAHSAIAQWDIAGPFLNQENLLHAPLAILVLTRKLQVTILAIGVLRGRSCKGSSVQVVLDRIADHVKPAHLDLEQGRHFASLAILARLKEMTANSSATLVQ